MKKKKKIDIKNKQTKKASQNVDWAAGTRAALLPLALLGTHSHWKL